MQKNTVLLSAMFLALSGVIGQYACAQDQPVMTGNRASEVKTYDREQVRRQRTSLRRELAESQQDRLESMRDYAASNSNVALEMNALDKLALVKGRTSAEYLFASLTFKLKQGGKAREEAQADLEKLCELNPQSYECIQGKARYNLSSPQMKVRLQPFYMHENNDDYEAAVKDLAEIFLDAPPLEHELRLRYYNMMGRIAGREFEAVSGLKNMLNELPEDNALTRRAKLLMNSFHASALANRALKDIDDPRKTKRAQADLAQALRLEPDGPDAAYWREILISSRYYRMVDQGDEALEKKQFGAATAAYRRASEVDPHSPYAYVGLARLYAEQQNEGAFNKAAAAAVANSKAESEAEQRRIRQTLNSMRGTFISAKASKAEEAGRYADAESLYIKALSYDPDNPWLYHSLGGVRAAQGNAAGAVGSFDQVADKVRREPEYAFAKALVLDRVGRTDEALDLLKPHVGKDPSIAATYARLREERALSQAGALVESGDHDAALALLDGISGARADALRAGIAYERGDRELAERYLNSSLLADPDQPYARLQLAQILHECGKDEEALAVAERLERDFDSLSLENRRALGQLYYDLGQKTRAVDIYERSLKDTGSRTAYTPLRTAVPKDDAADLRRTSTPEESVTYGPWITLREYHRRDADFLHRYRLMTLNGTYADMAEGIADNGGAAGTAQGTSGGDDAYTRAWIARNAALTSAELGETYGLSQRWRYALGVYDGCTAEYADDAVYTHALLTPDIEEDWLRESLRANAQKQYLRETVTINEGISYIRDSGHPGYSDNKGYVNVLNVTFPLFDGTGKIQTDRTMMNAGSLSGGTYEDMYGTIFAEGTDDLRVHRKVMNTYAFAFDNDNLHVDIGTAPKISGNQIKSTGIVGGASYKLELGDWSFTPEIYRRAKDNSILTFFGDRDPKTGRMYGAVKRTGIGISGSYYIDRNAGWWFTAGYETLTGTDVADNAQRRALTGIYYHVIDRPNERLTLSPSVMYMSYDRDLSGYTLGQGGYYSPQSYLSVGTALRYMRRYENTSYMVELSGSVAHSSTDSTARYPLQEILPDIPDRNATTTADSGTSFGFGLRGSIEQRITSRLVVGGVMEGSKSDDYSPFTAMLYLRYYLADFNGDLLMPPAGPTPFVDW